MPRVTRGFKARRRRNRVLKLAKGFRGGRSRLYKTATEAVDRALVYAYRDRRTKKRDFRRLWITRINAGARMNEMSYSKLMGGLKKANVEMDRKVLANMAILDAGAFTKVVEMAKAANA
jgi:large subunit ribosomal protein L20